MSLPNKTIEALSEKFARQFIRRMQTAEHMFDDLKQEAAIAIVFKASHWRQDGGANLETFTRIYAWKAMQQLCVSQSGPVTKTIRNGKFEGASYGASHAVDDQIASETPETLIERKQADEIVRELIERRARRFTGKGVLSKEAIKNALQDLMSGDTPTQVSQKYGCTRQRMQQLAVRAGVL